MLGAINSTDQKMLAVIHNDIAFLKRVELGRGTQGGERTQDATVNTLRSFRLHGTKCIILLRGANTWPPWIALMCLPCRMIAIWFCLRRDPKVGTSGCNVGQLLQLQRPVPPQLHTGASTFGDLGSAGSELEASLVQREDCRLLAVLAVLMNGDVIVYEMSSGTIVWATNTCQIVQLYPRSEEYC